MNAASASWIQEWRPRISERLARLQATARSLSADDVNSLLAEIDTTLRKIDDGSFGLCETCHDPIEEDRLEANPLVRFCLDHLSAEQARAHEQDLELATQIQTRLLPASDIRTRDWEAHYRYEPSGAVGGDYCEMIASGDGKSLFFAVGDVAGKGVAASLLMAHLSAIFRSLLSLDLPLTEVMSRANRLLCEGTPATHYATLVAGFATADGVDLCNAGHCRPLLLGRDGTDRIESAAPPLGLFCSGHYPIRHLRLNRGESLVLYSDGITEAQDPSGEAYEEDRLIQTLHAHAEFDASALAGSVLRDVARFRGRQPQQDDITLLVIRRRA
jgi:sigma-B regulation protein RsbU (phosphoserine phosphatase)